MVALGEEKDEDLYGARCEERIGAIAITTCRWCPQREVVIAGHWQMKASIPEDEARRLEALRRYQILDTPPEPAFDRIPEMAANFFHVPMARASLVDEDRVRFKSRIGIIAEQTARDAGLSVGDAV